MPSGKRWNVQHQFEAAAQYPPPAAKHYLVNDTTVAESDETNNCRASVQAPSRRSTDRPTRPADAGAGSASNSGLLDSSVRYLVVNLKTAKGE